MNIERLWCVQAIWFSRVLSLLRQASSVKQDGAHIAGMRFEYHGRTGPEVPHTLEPCQHWRRMRNSIDVRALEAVR